MVMAAFYLHPKVGLKSMLSVNFCHFSQFQPQSKLDRSLSFHHDLETLCKETILAASCLCGLRAQDGVQALKYCVQLPYPWFTLQLNTANQFGVALHPPILSTVFSMLSYTLILDAVAPHQWTTCQSFQASSQLSFTTCGRHSPWPSMAPWNQTICYTVN